MPRAPASMREEEGLRVALVVGTLGLGGAEKQLVYMAGALLRAGIDTRIYALTRGEYHEPELRALGVIPVWIGRHASPLYRAAALAAALRGFRPHVLQATHFYANLYATLVAPLFGAIGIGSIRSDVHHELETSGAWGRWLLRAPRVLLANSHAARRNAAAYGVDETRIHVVPNVIDLPAFDRDAGDVAREGDRGGPVTAIAVGRLVKPKRFERFLMALALARKEMSTLRGVVVGDGPERPRLERLAGELGLGSHGAAFLGRRDDVPALLRSADMLLLVSDREGFPNVILEGMAASLPVITTPAGDAALIVKDSVTGYHVPFDDTHAMASRMLQLARSRGLRECLGRAGRREAAEQYAAPGLADRLLACYGTSAERSG
ncbi:MAG TPA: glycosyltransferase [Gemmatimonadaceae bacterium]|nr:glycosyltransferase [Gemmatimonadaceae bacterium]